MEIQGYIHLFLAQLLSFLVCSEVRKRPQNYIVVTWQITPVTRVTTFFISWYICWYFLVFKIVCFHQNPSGLPVSTNHMVSTAIRYKNLCGWFLYSTTLVSQTVYKVPLPSLCVLYILYYDIMIFLYKLCINKSRLICSYIVWLWVLWHDCVMCVTRVN